MIVWTIVVAAGSGARFGGPKQFAPLGGRRVIDWSLDAARAVSAGVVVVVAPEVVDGPDASTLAAERVVRGGATRSASVRAGLAAVPAEAEVIVVHDAARPLATPATFAAVVEAVARGAAAALPGADVVDTIRLRGGGVVDRASLLAVQTPQAFAAAALRAAHGTDGEATDDVGLVEALLGTGEGVVEIVAGDRRNFKITEPEDLTMAGALLTAPSPWSQPRLAIGQGFDIHPFSDDPARPLVLGGVTFEGSRGLAGHSDADAVAHACTDALLGAAGLGDIGQLFPDTDERFRGADSLLLLAEAVRHVRAAGWVPGNVDCTVVTEAPKLAPRRAEMAERLSAVVGAPVTVKGKRAEGLGALGRREGIACWAVAIVTRP